MCVSFLNFLFFAYFFLSKLIDSWGRDVERWQELLLVNVFECNIRFVARSRMTIDFNFIFVLLLRVFFLFCIKGREKTQRKNETKYIRCWLEPLHEKNAQLILFLMCFFFFYSLDVMILLSTLPTFTTLNGVCVCECDRKKENLNDFFRRQYDVVHLFIRIQPHTHTQKQQQNRRK